jgi:hypothetical protein
MSVASIDYERRSPAVSGAWEMTVTLECDQCNHERGSGDTRFIGGYSSKVNPERGTFSRRAAADPVRAQAIAAGWTREEARDHCPEHSPSETPRS